jgi:hypothetical protein
MTKPDEAATGDEPAVAPVETPADVPPNVPGVDAAATAVDVAETNVDIGVTPLVAPVDQVDPTTVSQTDPSAPPLDSNVSEAQPDTPPTDNPDVYAQNLAANLAGAPASVESADVNPRYALRTEDQLKAVGDASAVLLEAVRGLCVAGLTRAQLLDSCVLAVEQLYVERNDAKAAGHDDPYPVY